MSRRHTEEPWANVARVKRSSPDMTIGYPGRLVPSETDLLREKVKSLEEQIRILSDLTADLMPPVQSLSQMERGIVDRAGELFDAYRRDGDSPVNGSTAQGRLFKAIVDFRKASDETPSGSGR